MADPAYNETLIAMLAEIGKRRGYFVLPIVRHLPSLRIIDGYHRLEVIRRLEAEDSSLKIGHCFRDIEVDDPDTLAIELNKARRPWDDAEERRTQAQILAATPVPGGRRRKGGKPDPDAVGFPSNPQIAAVLGVDESTVREDLKATSGNPEVNQTPSGAANPKQTAPATAAMDDKEAIRQQRRTNLRAQCRAAGINEINGKPLYSAGMKAMEAALGMAKPTASTTRTKTTTTTLSTTTTNGTLEAATAEPEADDSTLTTDPTEHLNAEQLRDHCAAEVAKSDRPDDYKRAIQLLAELDHIITAAWRRQHPEPWIAGDWSHVSGELQALHSIAYQRALELNKPIFEKFTAVTVAASSVS